jgi:hypothetical protein
MARPEDPLTLLWRERQHARDALRRSGGLRSPADAD